MPCWRQVGPKSRLGGYLGPLRSHLGRTSRPKIVLRASWARLEASWARLGRVLARLGRVWARLGASWARRKSQNLAGLKSPHVKKVSKRPDMY